MKTALLMTLLLLSPGGDRERGLRLLAEGRYAEAAAAFRAALASSGDDPELHYNLALAAWRAGELDAAEEAAEKMAALAGDRLGGRHGGILGAVRHDESVALEQQSDALGGENLEQQAQLLGQALHKAQQSRDYFARAGTRPDAGAKACRNLERLLRRVANLEKKVEELKQQQQQQDQQQGEQQGEQPPKEGEQQQGEPKPEPDTQSRPQPDPSQTGEQPPGEAEKRPEPQPGEDQPSETDAQPRTDAPGEGQVGELSPEQQARLHQVLEQLDERLKAYRARARSSRKPVERDW